MPGVLCTNHSHRENGATCLCVEVLSGKRQPNCCTMHSDSGDTGPCLHGAASSLWQCMVQHLGYSFPERTFSSTPGHTCCAAANACAHDWLSNFVEAHVCTGYIPTLEL